MEDANKEHPLLKRIFIATKANNDSELATKLDLTRQSVSKGRTTGEIPPSWVYKVAKEYNISSDWLYFGTGSMLRSDHPNNSPIIQDKYLTTELLDNVVMIPMVKAKLSAGGGSFETSDEIEEMISFKRDFIMQKGNPKNMVVMRVSGDSMEPEVFDNDIVLIDQSKTEVLASKIYAVSFEDCIYLKRVDLLPKQIALKSTNPAYPPVILDLCDNMDHLFKIVGRVLWMSREYS